MSSSFYLQHAKRFGLGATARYGAWRLAERMFGYASYTCFIRPVAGRVPGPLTDGAFECRLVGFAELEHLASDARYDLSAALVRSAASRGDICVGAFADSRLIGYGFASRMPTDIDDDFRFHFPASCVYNYKAFVLPEWRGRHIHAALWLARQKFFEALGSQYLVGCVRASNYPSLGSFRRLAFRPAFSFAIAGKGRARRLYPGRGARRAGEAIVCESLGLEGEFKILARPADSITT